jgi:hypothetical protein
MRIDGTSRYAPVGKLKRRKIIYRAEEEIRPVMDDEADMDDGDGDHSAQAVQRQGNASRQAEDEDLQHPQHDQTRQDPHPRLAARRPPPNAPIDRLAMRLQAEDDDVMIPPPAVPEVGEHGRGIDRNGALHAEDATSGAVGVGLEAGPGWEEQTVSPPALPSGRASQVWSTKESELTFQILSIHCPNGYNIAAAVWDHEVRKMLVMEDTKDTTGFDLAVLGELTRYCRAPYV